MPKLITNNNEVLMKSKRFHLMSQTDLNKIGVLDSIKQDEYAIRKTSISESALLKSTWKIERTFNRVKSTKNGSLEIGGISYLVKVPARVETSRDYNIVTYGGQNSYNLGSLLNGYNIFSSYDPTTFVSLVDVPESVNLYAVTGGTTSFFTQVGQQYTVTLSVAVELAKTVEVEVYVGSLSFSRFALDSDEYHYTKNGQEI
jgi:hypothetical protein